MCGSTRFLLPSHGFAQRRLVDMAESVSVAVLPRTQYAGDDVSRFLVTTKCDTVPRWQVRGGVMMMRRSSVHTTMRVLSRARRVPCCCLLFVGAVPRLAPCLSSPSTCLVCFFRRGMSPSLPSFRARPFVQRALAQVSKKEGKALAAKYRVPFYITSANDSIGVLEAFADVAGEYSAPPTHPRTCWCAATDTVPFATKCPMSTRSCPARRHGGILHGSEV